MTGPKVSATLIIVRVVIAYLDWPVLFPKQNTRISICWLYNTVINFQIPLTDLLL